MDTKSYTAEELGLLANFITPKTSKQLSFIKNNTIASVKPHSLVKQASKTKTPVKYRDRIQFLRGKNKNFKVYKVLSDYRSDMDIPDNENLLIIKYLEYDDKLPRIPRDVHYLHFEECYVTVNIPNHIKGISFYDCDVRFRAGTDLEELAYRSCDDIEFPDFSRAKNFYAITTSRCYGKYSIKDLPDTVQHIYFHMYDYEEDLKRLPRDLIDFWWNYNNINTIEDYHRIMQKFL